MEKKQLKLSNGEIILYLDKGQSEYPLILIHGNFSSSLHYLPLYEKIPETLRVIVPDLRGFGDSSYNNPIETLKDFADDVYLLMQELGVKKAFIAGWSLGGGVALEFAAAHPDIVKKMVLINSTTHRGYPVFRKNELGQPIIGEVYQNKEALGSDPIQVIPLLNAIKDQNFDIMNYIWNLTIYTVNKPEEDLNQMLIKESLKQRNLIDADWALANFNMSNTHNLYHPGTNRIGDITCEVLHIWGDKDIVVPEYMILENVNSLKNSRYIKYENCGHSPITDKLEVLTKDILEFIKT